MGQIFEILLYVFLGIALFWFGYTLFSRMGIPALSGLGRGRKDTRTPTASGNPGEPQTCPVCSAKLNKGEQVSSAAFPSLNGGKDRFMHILGCLYCLRGDRDRVCPVCGIILKVNEILITRLFERRGTRPHVHVLGCTCCKGPRANKLKNDSYSCG